MRLSLFTATIFWLATALLGMAQTGQPQDCAFEKAEGHQIGEPAPLFFGTGRLRFFAPEDSAPVLSKLHAMIQDTFNEFTVQIMSPHFQSQPSSPVFVLKSQWYSEPAERLQIRRNGEL
jgi:hypothetical protein